MEQELDLLATDAARLLSKKYPELRKGETILIDFSFHRGIRQVHLELVNEADDSVMEFFVHIPDIEGQKAIELGLDFLDGVLEEFFLSKRESIPRLDPAPYEFEGHTLYLSGGMRRPALEQAADALLKGVEDPQGTKTHK